MLIRACHCFFCLFAITSPLRLLILYICQIVHLIFSDHINAYVSLNMSSTWERQYEIFFFQFWKNNLWWVNTWKHYFPVIFTSHFPPFPPGSFAKVLLPTSGLASGAHIWVWGHLPWPTLLKKIDSASPTTHQISGASQQGLRAAFPSPTHNEMLIGLILFGLCRQPELLEYSDSCCIQETPFHPVLPDL